MPKSPRAPQSDQRHNPLASEYTAEHSFKQKAPKKRNRKDEADGEHFISAKASRKILKIGQELVDEDEAERQAKFPAPPNPAFAFETRLERDAESEEEKNRWDDEEAWGDEEVVEIEVGLIVSRLLAGL
jgi:essential nuclear protein 1